MPARAQVHVVSSLANAGLGTFRAAIDSANTRPGPDTITFNLAGTAPFVIGLTSALPAFTDSFTVVDGTTQPGYSFGSVVLDGTNCPINFNALQVDQTANGFELYGLYIRSFGWSGFSTSAGLRIDASNVIIGRPGKGNIISGNNHGILIAAHRSTGVRVQGNYIGVQPNGTTAEGNSRNGIYVAPFSGTIGGNFQIGGSRAAGEGNLVGSSGWAHIALGGRARVQGNILGTDKNLAQAFGNGWNNIAGVNLNAVSVTSGSNGSIIGGANPEYGNLIAHANAMGIMIQFTSRVRVAYNTIYDAGSGAFVYPAVRIINSDSVRVTRNSMYCNFQGIDLLGTTANQNKAAPDITTATATTFIGTAAPGDSIEVFAHDVSCTSAQCQGRVFLGGTRANGVGLWTLSGSFSFLEATATATDAGGRTSEFSVCRPLDYILEQTELPAGLVEAAISRAQLFPNPASGLVTLRLPASQSTDPWRVSLSSLAGKRLAEWTLEPDSREQALQVGAFTSGVYTLRVRNAQQHFILPLRLVNP